MWLMSLKYLDCEVVLVSLSLSLVAFVNFFLINMLDHEQSDTNTSGWFLDQHFNCPYSYLSNCALNVDETEPPNQRCQYSSTK